MSETQEIQFKGNFPKVLGAFKIMDFVPNIDSFEDRIIVQKSIFLLQLKELDFGYTDYDLFLRGPYSPHLTKDMFAWWKALPEEFKNNVREETKKQRELRKERDKK